MTCSGIYDSALRAVSETDCHGNTADYEERSGYLLATFCHECAAVDKGFRRANGMTPQRRLPGVRIAPEAVFPLADAFVPAAVYYLAAMLILDENEAVSDRFFSLYSDSLATLQASIPAVSEKITDKYPQ